MAVALRRWFSGCLPRARRSLGTIRFYKVYTRTGDKGESSLYNGNRAAKTSPYFEALGNTDELNSFAGMALHHCQKTQKLGDLVDMLSEIQSRLLDVGSHIATPKLSSQEDRIRTVEFDVSHAEQLEAWIDKMDEELPALKNFILPGGGEAACALHIARSVTRRTERSVINLVHQGEADESVLKYLNRLSDFFFMAARYAAIQTGEAEVVYKKERKE